MIERTICGEGITFPSPGKHFNLDSFNPERGVMQEITFINNYVNTGKYAILSKAKYDEFLNDVDTLTKSLENTILSQEQFDSISKAIDDSNSLRPITYRTTTGHDITAYIKEVESLDVPNPDSMVVYDKSGIDIIKSVEVKRGKLVKRAEMLKDKLDFLYDRLPLSLEPESDTADYVSKAFTDKYGAYRTFSMKQCFPEKEVRQFHALDELEKSYIETEESLICRQYNEAVFDYINETVELMQTNELLKGIDPQMNYKLNTQQYITLFGNESIL